jgi:type IV pilus biogenesis protein CpaD/CtpE
MSTSYLLRLFAASVGAACVTSLLSGCADQAPPAPAVPAAPGATAQSQPVSVGSVHDAATVVLTDGTRLRQVGISAPNADTCQAKQSTATRTPRHAADR